MLLGRFDFTELKAADRILGPFFFMAFTISLTFTLLNMFIVILDDSIKKVCKLVIVLKCMKLYFKLCELNMFVLTQTVT